MIRQREDRIIGWAILVAGAAAVASAFSLQVVVGFALGVVVAIGATLVVIGPDIGD